MRQVTPVCLVGVVAACGGAAARSTDPPAGPTRPPPTRVVVEDEAASGEAAEDGVSFVRSKGSITREAIEAGIAPHQAALAECYTGKVGKRRWLGGNVVLQWVLQADGQIAAVRVVESDLGAWPVEQCLVDIAWGASFGKPNGGAVDFTLPLEFSARGATSIWSEDQALRAVGGQLALLDDCDDLEVAPRGAKRPKKPAPATSPAAPGARGARPEHAPSNVTLTLYVGPGGALQSVGFSSATTEVGQRWAACAEQVAQGWRLPDPRGQIAKLALRYKAE